MSSLLASSYSPILSLFQIAFLTCEMQVNRRHEKKILVSAAVPPRFVRIVADD
jgi:hypothetical protein